MDIEAAIVCASERLGYTSIRPNQYKAVRSFMDHKDVFISLPTGSGKSFCFAVLPLAFDNLYQRVGSIVIVVSPLIALMKDQVQDDRIARAFCSGVLYIVFIGSKS